MVKQHCACRLEVSILNEIKMFENLKNTRYMQYVAAIAATLSNAASAMYGVWPSPVLSLLQSEDFPVGRPISDEEGSWVVSIPKLAAIPAAIVGAWSVERFGRKYSLLAAGILVLFPWFMIMFANSIWVIYAARLIAGIGGGIIVISCAMYNAEIAEKEVRGKLGSTFTILKMLGSLFILCIGPYISYRNLAIISSILPLIFLCVYFFIPESPYYLVKVKKVEQAERNLKILSSSLVDDKLIKERIMEIEKSVEEDMKNKSTLWEFLANKEYRMAIIIMFGIKTLQQLSGDAAIDAYMQPIIASTGSNISEETSSVIFGFVQLPGALLAGYLVDKVGRKPLLISSAAGCSVALFALGTYFYFQDVLEADVSGAAWLPTSGIAVFVFMNNVGIITLPYVLLGELFPTNIKEIAVSAATMYGGIMAFVVSKLFKPLTNVWGEYTLFWIFGSICALGIVFVALMVPETKGKTFSEIQQLLKKEKVESKQSDERC